jgi:hypothetical protein
MPIPPVNFPALQELSNGEQAISVVFNRPLFALSTRTEALKTLAESVESEIVTARDSYSTLDDRLDAMVSSSSASITNIVSDRNIFLVGGSATWNATASTFTYSQITLAQPNLSYDYTINAGSMASIADGDSLYVTLSRNPMSTTLTLTRVALGLVPNDEDTFIIAIRRGGRLWVRNNGEFEDQETREIGDGLTSAILGRLEMVNETDTASHFTNNIFQLVGDGIPTAISKHDVGLTYLTRDRNALLHGGGNVTWTIPGPTGTFAFDADIYVDVPSVGKVTITATSIPSIADGEVLYFNFLRTSGNYTVSLSKISSISLPITYASKDSFVLGYRSGTTFVMRTGDVFQAGETKPLGTGGAGLVTYQNMSLFASSEDDVSWDALSGLVDCTGNVTIHFPWTTISNIIQATEFPFMLSTSGKKAYVILDRENQANVTIVDDVDTIPITYSQPDALLVAERVGDAMYLFEHHRYNDGDIRRVGEGFVAGAIYDETYTITTASNEVVIPSGQIHYDDAKTLKVWGNGAFLDPAVDYEEDSLDNTKIKARTGEMFPDGNFPEDMRLRFRVESIVTGGAGPGGGGGITWGDPVDNNIVPDLNNTRNLGSSLKGFREIYLADQTNIGDVYKLFIDSGSLQIVLM